MKDGSDLERLRARQMLELLKEPPLKCFVPEVAQLVLEEVTVFGREEFRFRFLDGTIKEV